MALPLAPSIAIVSVLWQTIRTVVGVTVVAREPSLNGGQQQVAFDRMRALEHAALAYTSQSPELRPAFRALTVLVSSPERWVRSRYRLSNSDA